MNYESFECFCMILNATRVQEKEAHSDRSLEALTRAPRCCVSSAARGGARISERNVLRGESRS